MDAKKRDMAGEWGRALRLQRLPNALARAHLNCEAGAINEQFSNSEGKSPLVFYLKRFRFISTGFGHKHAYEKQLDQRNLLSGKMDTRYRGSSSG